MMNNDVVFVDTSKEVKDIMVKLSKSALRASGKTAGKLIKENTSIRTGALKNQVGYWAKIDRFTGQPELQIGYYSKQRTRKKGKIPSHANPAWEEFGTNAHTIKIKKALTLTDGKIRFGKSVNHPGLTGQSILRNSVLNNIDLIRDAQKKYLSELNKTIKEITETIDESEEDENV